MGISQKTYIFVIQSVPPDKLYPTLVVLLSDDFFFKFKIFFQICFYTSKTKFVFLRQYQVRNKPLF